MEPGLVTLAKIVGLLVVCISTIPLLFLTAPGQMGEPEHNPIDPEREH
ncbi:MAG: hypothetical protein IT376_16200 [Polyangiaceae bacterium]|nr:hypothetical protein [Polyangiaceae bacterium]